MDRLAPGHPLPVWHLRCQRKRGGLAVHGETLVLLGGATLGSYTTFSTWMLQTRRLALDGEASLAILNVVLSLAAGVGAVALGRAIGMGL